MAVTDLLLFRPVKTPDPPNMTQVTFLLYDNINNTDFVSGFLEAICTVDKTFRHTYNYRCYANTLLYHCPQYLGTHFIICQVGNVSLNQLEADL